MDDKILETINQYFDFCGYDPEQKSFTFERYEMHSTCKMIEELLDKYDANGIISMIYLKKHFDKYIKALRYHAYDLLSGKIDISKEQKIFNVLNSNIYTDVENQFINTIKTVVARMDDKLLIGNDEEYEQQMVNVVVDSICAVVESIKKLKMRVFLKGNSSIIIDEFYTKLLVYKSLSQCLLDLEGAKDNTIYLVYIANGNTNNGFFGFFIKSNGWLLSFDEKYDEAYIGQSNMLRSGRVISDNKAWDIFPYDLIKTSAPDYKGYYTKYEIDEDKTDFRNMGIENWIPSFIAMLFLTKKLEGIDLSKQEILYVDSLLKKNIQKLEGIDASNQLMVCDKSLILAQNDLSFNINREDVLKGNISKFNQSGKIDEKLFVDSYIDEIIKDYGYDYELDEKDILSTDSYLLLGDNSSNATFEFIGTKEELELQAFHKERNNLYKLCKKNIENEFNGLFKEDYPRLANYPNDRCEQWFYDRCKENRQAIVSLVIEWLKKTPQENIGEVVLCGERCYDEKTLKEMDFVEIAKTKYFGGICINDFEGKEPIDFFNGKKCNVIFRVKALGGIGIKKLVNTEIPKLMKHYISERSSLFGMFSKGNSILSYTDPMADIKTPFEGKRTHFFITVGFSKSSLNKLLKK